MLPTRPVTTSAAEPARVSAVLLASAVALTVTVSSAPLAVIEVAAEPVVIAMPLSTVSPVVTVSAPVSAPAAMLPTSPVTTSAAEPARVSAVLLASAAAATVIVSLAAARRDRGRRRAGGDRDAVVDRIAGRHGQRPGQRARRDIPDQPGHRSAAEPASVSVVLWASLAPTATVSVADVSVIEVAAEPVVIAMPSSAYRRWSRSASRSARSP